jgi:hypothetical protein
MNHDDADRGVARRRRIVVERRWFRWSACETVANVLGAMVNDDEVQSFLAAVLPYQGVMQTRCCA